MANSDITLHIQPFRTDLDPASLGENWKYWLEEFEYELYLQRVTDDNDKIMCLKRYGGRELRLIVKYLPSTEQKGNNTYEEVKRKLNQHFKPKQNKQHAKYLFKRMKLENNETITEYAVRLKEQAESCESETTDRILEQLIQTTEDRKMIKEK